MNFIVMFSEIKMDRFFQTTKHYYKESKWGLKNDEKKATFITVYIIDG